MQHKHTQTGTACGHNTQLPQPCGEQLHHCFATSACPSCQSNAHKSKRRNAPRQPAGAVRHTQYHHSHATLFTAPAAAAHNTRRRSTSLPRQLQLQAHTSLVSQHTLCQHTLCRHTLCQHTKKRTPCPACCPGPCGGVASAATCLTGATRQLPCETKAGKQPCICRHCKRWASKSVACEAPHSTAPTPTALSYPLRKQRRNPPWRPADAKEQSAYACTRLQQTHCDTLHSEAMR